MTDVEPMGVKPPTNWVEQLDAAIDDEPGSNGPPPADLVASWLTWYAQQLAELHESYRVEQRRLERATRLARQLTTIIVEELASFTVSVERDYI